MIGLKQMYNNNNIKIKKMSKMIRMINKIVKEQTNYDINVKSYII
jgi:hypothetical protein